MNVVVLIGPPAVGKMAVGMQLSKLTNYKLFHNHMSIEFLIKVWEHGSPEFNKLNSLLRWIVFEEASKSDLPGFIFTYVVDFDDEEREKRFIERFAETFQKEGHVVFYVELEAELSERLRRNKTELRIREKPSKSNTVLSDEQVIKMDEKHRMNSENGSFLKEKNYLKLITTNLTEKETAERIVKRFNF